MTTIRVHGAGKTLCDNELNSRIKKLVERVFGVRGVSRCARAAGIARTTLVGYIEGVPPPAAAIAALCDATGGLADWLLWGRGPMLAGDAAQESGEGPAAYGALALPVLEGGLDTGDQNGVQRFHAGQAVVLAGARRLLVDTPDHFPEPGDLVVAWPRRHDLLLARLASRETRGDRRVMILLPVGDPVRKIVSLDEPNCLGLRVVLGELFE